MFSFLTELSILHILHLCRNFLSSARSSFVPELSALHIFRLCRRSKAKPVLVCACILVPCILHLWSYVFGERIVRGKDIPVDKLPLFVKLTPFYH